MSKSTRPAVIIPNWNGADLLRPCIDSLLAQSMACDVIVVENGSVDESDAILETYGEKIVVLKQEKNLGFAGGVNIGIRYAMEHGCEYIALFNNDAVAEPGWLGELVGALQRHKDAGVAASKVLLDDRQTIDAIGTCYSIFGAPFTRGHNEPDTGQYDQADYVFGAYGCGSLYRASLLADTGLFDEDYFAYLEEDDMNFRSQLRGYRVITAPRAVIYHASGSTSGRLPGFTAYQRTKNFWFLYGKNMPGWLFWKYLPLATSWFFLMFTKRLREGNIIPFLRGTATAILYAPKTIRKRRQIQRSKRVSSSYISSLLHHGLPIRGAKET
ncbi:MAG: glycosyltransferase family 2 protein [Candidatus Saccharimonadales bacterium]